MKEDEFYKYVRRIQVTAAEYIKIKSVITNKYKNRLGNLVLLLLSTSSII
jgi:hypothetical protein